MLNYKEFLKRREENKKRTKEKLDKVPPIHWEILRYSNTHTKEQTLEAYPDHTEFINSIIYQ